MVASGFLLISLFAIALANPFSRRAVQVLETQVMPEGFSQQGPAPSDQVLNMRLALTQNNRNGLIQALMDVSEPTSALYGQYLTKEEVRRPVISSPSLGSMAHHMLCSG